MKSTSRFLNRGKGFILALILGLLMMAFHAAGQSFLSLSDAIALGMKNNYSIRMARNDSVMTARNMTFGNAGMLPTVSAFASWDKASLDAKVSTTVAGTIEKKGAPASLISAGLQARWTLFDGTAMFIEYDKLRSLALMANLDLRMEIENTVHAVTESYLDIIRQRQIVDACKKSLEISNLRRSVAAARFLSGSGSEQEMLQAEVIRLADTTALTKQTASLKQAEIKLNQLLAVDLREYFMPEDTITLIGLPPLEQLIDKARQANGSFLLAEESHRISDLEVRLLRAKQLPSLTLNGSYNYTENETQASFINYSRTFGPYIGLSAAVSIFDGMNLNRKINHAELMRENQGIRLKELEQQLTAYILDAWYEHQNLLQVVVLGKEGIRMAEKNMAIAEDAFTSGLISSLQLREAQDDLFHSRCNLFDALFQARVMESELLRLSGELVKKAGYDDE